MGAGVDPNLAKKAINSTLLDDLKGPSGEINYIYLCTYIPSPYSLPPSPPSHPSLSPLFSTFR